MPVVDRTQSVLTFALVDTHTENELLLPPAKIPIVIDTGNNRHPPNKEMAEAQ